MTGETPYHNREIQEMFKAADDRADSFHDKLMDKLDGIEFQTTKTNGSIADINRWRERVNGMAIASGVFMTIVVMPVLAWAIFVLVNIQEQIHQAVDDALQAYDIKPQ